MEYGEVATEAVGRGIKLALRLINDLEINEQILYARMEDVEESSLESTIRHPIGASGSETRDPNPASRIRSDIVVALTTPFLRSRK